METPHAGAPWPRPGSGPSPPTPVPGGPVRPPSGHGSQRMIGPFEVLGELGRGGVGLVYRARDTRAGNEVALKVLLQGVDTSPQRLERFRREAVITAALDHPGIVRALDAGMSNGRPWVAFELVEGARTLHEVLPALPVRRRVELIRDAARALGAAHRRAVVHRDMKPANVLVDGAGRVRVTDFGLAAARGMSALTQTGSLVGTPLWMSPEQADARKELIGPATDVWGLGVILYEALTGALPFQAASLMDLVDAIRRRAPPPPRQVAPGVDAALEAVCLRALEKDPARRQPDGEALAAELDRVLAAAGRADDLARSDKRAGGAPAAPARRSLVAVHLALAVAGVALLAALLALRAGPSPAELVARGHALERDDPAAARVAYEQAARRGEVAAMAPLARLLDAGRGGPPDPGAAAAWWARAAERGDAAALRDLARRDERRGDLAAAAASWRRAAAAGDVAAMLELAARLDEGRGLARDPAGAATWWRRAAERGHAGAMRALAAALARDDPDLAAGWLRRAAEQDDAEAMVRLAVLLEADADVADALGPVAWLQRAAAAGHPEAMLLLADHLERGRGVARDEAGAAAWLERAARAGHAPAMAALAARLRARDPAAAAAWLRRGAVLHDPACMHALGRALLEGQGVARDDAAAFAWLVRAAALGEGGAATLVGGQFEHGKGVVQDDRRAREWFARGAALGDPGGMTSLGVFMVEGRGGPKDAEEAVRLFRRAAAAGLPQAMFDLGRALERGTGVAQDRVQALAWYRHGVTAGSPRCMVRLAQLLEADAAGRPGPIAEAADLYRRAAELGDVTGMNNWAHALATGEGVARDEAQAAAWFRRAAEGGSATSMVNYALFLRDGRGAPQDRAEAARWARRAADLDDERGKKLLAELEGAGPAGLAGEGALEALRRAAEGGDAAAAVALGKALRDGAGVTRDPAAAARWLRRAADAGDAQGMALLADLLLTGVGTPRDVGEALRLYGAAAEKGEPGGMAGLGRLLLGSASPTTWADGVRLLGRAAAAGHGPAMIHLAWAMTKGRGARRSANGALRMLQRAAAAGEGEAVLRLAQLLDDLGRSKQARELWTLAAEKGDPRAMLQLARLHERGRGGPADPEAAGRWLARAVDAGLPDALVSLARSSRSDPAQEAELWRRAADAGHTGAMVELSRREGDPAAARAWLERAAARGDAEAALLLAAQAP